MGHVVEKEKCLGYSGVGRTLRVISFEAKKLDIFFSEWGMEIEFLYLYSGLVIECEQAPNIHMILV